MPLRASSAPERPADVTAYLASRPSEEAFRETLREEAQHRVGAMERGTTLIKFNAGKGMFGKKSEQARMVERWLVLNTKLGGPNTELAWGDPKTRKLSTQVRLERSAALAPLDRLHLFESFIRDREREEDTKRRDERAAQRRRERQARDAFKALLDEGEKEGWLHLRALWHEAFSQVEATAEFKAMLDTAGSTARELFEAPNPDSNPKPNPKPDRAGGSWLEGPGGVAAGGL